MTFTIFLLSTMALRNVFNINRFKQQVITSGYVDKDGKAHCLSPLLFETGFIPFEVSTDGGLTFPYSGTWLSGYLLQSVVSPFFCILASQKQDDISLSHFLNGLFGLKKVILDPFMAIPISRDEVVL